jgi:hypothetical protein
MGMDDADFALARILAKCKTRDDLNRYIMSQAIILQYLVCHMGREVNQTEAGIRTLYDAFADMAVEQFNDPKGFPGRKLH